MFITPQVMRTLLFVCMIGMAILAAVYLSRRRLSFYDYLAWGLLAILVPVIGPFLVILSRPGEWHPQKG
ncbi:MAG: hypothetical protein P8074_03930 [Anaerolineales bacterium]|jgi:hypothetical protein